MPSGTEIPTGLPTLLQPSLSNVTLDVVGMGATLLDALSRSADKLRQAKGRLYLTGISERAYEQAVRTGKLHLNGQCTSTRATPVLGESTRTAYVHALAWLVGAPSPDEARSDAVGR